MGLGIRLCLCYSSPQIRFLLMLLSDFMCVCTSILLCTHLFDPQSTEWDFQTWIIHVYSLGQLIVCILLHEQLSNFNRTLLYHTKRRVIDYTIFAFHSYTVYDFNQFLDTLYVYNYMCLFSLSFVLYFFHSNSVYIFICYACCVFVILVYISYHNIPMEKIKFEWMNK